MHLKKYFTAGFLGSFLLLSACTKTGNTGPAGATGAAGPAGPAGPSYTGAISGHVDLYDQYGSKILTGLSNVQISLNGNSIVNPDATGFYRFGNINTGSYFMTASNSGFGATRINNFQYLSDTLNHDVKLSAIPGFVPTTINSTIIATGDSVALTFPMDSRTRNCILFVNTSAIVNGNPANYLIVYTKAVAANTVKPTTILIAKQDLTDAGIMTGSTVFIAAYGYVVGDASAYEDFGTGKTVYTAISSSALTATFTAP